MAHRRALNPLPALALDRVHHDHVGLVRARLCGFDGIVDCLHVVAVDLLHVPAERAPLLACVEQGVDLVDRRVDLLPVEVKEAGQRAELHLSSIHAGFPDLPFLAFAITDDAVDAGTVAVDPVSERHADGGGQALTEGNDIAIIATGLMVNEARMAAEQLAAEGIHARVINIHTIKPLDEEIVIKAAKECGKVITAEEHNVIGGLGEAVCAVLSEKLPTPVRRVGVQDVFGCSGPAWDLLKKFGLDAATICKTAHEMLGK